MTRGRVVTAPEEYANLVLVPALLHIDPMVFMSYPPGLQIKMRNLMMHYIAAGGMTHGGS